MGQLRTPNTTAGSGPKMTEDEVTAYVKSYGPPGKAVKLTAQPGGTTVTGTVSGREFKISGK